jgi:uncharacterized protein YaiL (DUF2058 family)
MDGKEKKERLAHASPVDKREAVVVQFGNRAHEIARDRAKDYEEARIIWRAALGVH